MPGCYPNYERCHTRLVEGDCIKCLMDEYNLCPQKTSYVSFFLCSHPDNYKFAIDASVGRLHNTHC